MQLQLAMSLVAHIGPAFVQVNSTACIAESTRFYATIMSYLVSFRPQTAAKPEYDFVIVGGGTAGCVLARRLSEERGWSVLLLEAGGEEPVLAHVPAYARLTWNSALDWGFTTVPDNRSCGGVGCHWPRGRVLGGCSTINHMVYVRGNKADFDHWEQLGNPGWGYDHILHYFKKSEDNWDDSIDQPLHGRGGPQKIERMPYADVNVWALLQALQEMGYLEGDVNGVSQENTVMRAQTFSFDGQRQSANRAFLEPVRRRRGNLKVVTNATVTRIVVEGGRAVAVEYTTENRSTVSTVRVRKECILSAGAVNSPQILMVSGIGPRARLDSLGINVVKDLSVGENLQDHVSSSGLRFLLNETSQLRCSQRNLDYAEYLKWSRGPLAGIGSTEVTAFGDAQPIGDEGNYTAPAVQYMFDGFILTPSNTSQLTTSCYYKEIWPRLILMHPRSHGYITIASSDPYAKPLIYPNYFSEQDDVDTLVEALQRATNLISTPTLSKLGYTLNTHPLPGCENFDFNSSSYWECTLREYTQTIYHPVGTCKMGPSNDTTAVVDHELKVHGVDNLRVIDASVMPKIPTGNTEAAVLMIAEKGADMIKSKWKTKVYSHF